MPPTSYDPNSADEQPVALPSSPLISLSPNTVLQPPLTRRGNGPGLILLLPSPDSLNAAERAVKSLDPGPVQKWAEEGFAVVGVTSGGDWSVRSTLNKALDALVARNEVDTKDKVGIIGMGPIFPAHE
jgi:carboxymethylenebutenolidase